MVWALALMWSLLSPGGPPVSSEEPWRLWRNGPMGVEVLYPEGWDGRILRCGNEFMDRKDPVCDDYAPEDWDYLLFGFAKPGQDGGNAVGVDVYFHPNADGHRGGLVGSFRRVDGGPNEADGVSEWAMDAEPQRAWVVLRGHQRLTIRAHRATEEADIETLRQVARRVRLLDPDRPTDPAADGWRTWTTDEFVVQYPEAWQRRLSTVNEAAAERYRDDAWTSPDDALNGPFSPDIFRGGDRIVMRVRGIPYTGRREGRPASASGWIESRTQGPGAVDSRFEHVVFRTASGLEGARERFNGPRSTFVHYMFFAEAKQYSIEFQPTGRWRDAWLERMDDIVRRFRLIDPDVPAQR